MKLDISTGPHPDTLEIIANELAREIADTNQRQANAITRSSIVLAAAGLTLFLPFSTSVSLPLLVCLIFAIASTVTALITVSYWKSIVTDFSKDKVDVYLKMEPQELLEQLVKGLRNEYAQVVSDLDRKTGWATCSLVFLASSWFFYLLHLFLVITN